MPNVQLPPIDPSTGSKQDVGNDALVSINEKTPTLSGGKVPVAIDSFPIPTGASTEAKQDTGNSSLSSILAKLSSDPATQTTLAAILTKLSADPSTATLQSSILAKISSDPATQTTLEAVRVLLALVESKTPSLESGAVPVTLELSNVAQETGGNLAAVLAKLSSDPATQTTLEAVLTKLSADPATQTTLSAILTALTTGPVPSKLYVGANPVSATNPVPVGPPLSGALPVSASALPLPSGAATEGKQDTGNTSLGNIDTKLASQATGAKQDTGNNSLSSIDGKIPAKGAAAIAGSIPVNIASDQVIPASLATLPTNNSVFRDEFDVDILDAAKWSLIQTGSGMAVSFLNSMLHVKAGTTANSETIIRSVNKYSFESLFKWALQRNFAQIDQEVIIEVLDAIPAKFTGATWTKVTNGALNFTSVSGSNVITVNTGTPVVGAFIAGTGISSSTFIMAIDGALAILNNNCTSSATNNTTSHLSLQIDVGTPHLMVQGNWIELLATSDATMFGYNTSTIGTLFLVTGVASATRFYVIPNNGTFAGGAGPGTLDFYAISTQNIMRWIHDGATATTGRFQVWSDGFSYTTALNSLAGVAISTPVNPGMIGTMRCNDGVAWCADLTNNSASGMTVRAARENKIPQGSTEGYIQIRIKNVGAPATAQYIDFDFIRTLIMDELPVFIAGRGMSNNAKEANSVTVAAFAPTNTSFNLSQVVGATPPGGVHGILPVAGSGELMHPVPAFSAGSATPADGTNSLMYDAFPGRDAEWAFYIGGGNAANTFQIEGTNDGINFYVIPMNRVNNLATSMYALALAVVSTTVGYYTGRTYGFAKLRVHQVARTTTGTSGVLRIIPNANSIEQTVSYVCLTAANTTEVAPTNGYTTAISAVPTGGVRTLVVNPYGPAKAVLEVDASTGVHTFVMEGFDGTTWSALDMCLAGGAGGAAVASVTSAGTTALPQSGVYEADCSYFKRVRVRISAYTAGTLYGALKVIPMAGSKLSNTNEAVVQLGGSNVGPFGDLGTTELTPVVQLAFQYGILAPHGAGTVLNSAVVDTNGSRLRLQSGTNSAGSAIYQSRIPARYRTGQGVVARFSPTWDGATASNEQFMGVGTVEDAYGFGFNGTAFGIKYRAASVDTWITQANWNGDLCDGNGRSKFTWDKTKGNVCAIRYPFLGYGPITFWVLHPTGYWILCHTIQYPNSQAATQIQNPSLFFLARNINAGSTTARIMYCGSVGIFSFGQVAFPTSPAYGSDSKKTTVTTEANILTLRNATSYNGIPNRGIMRLRSLSVASDSGNDSAVFRLKLGVTLGGAPSFGAVDGTTADAGVTVTAGQSMASVDTAGTTIANGKLKYNCALARNSNFTVDLTPFNILLAPGETITLSGASATSMTMHGAINWDEEV